MDSHLEDAYESGQGADVDDLADGFEWWDRDETDDGEEVDDQPLIDIDDADCLPSIAGEDDTPIVPWPSQAEKDDYERRQPEPEQADAERERIAEEWDRWGDDWPAVLG